MLDDIDELEKLAPAPKGQKGRLVKEMDEAWNEIRQLIERNRQTSFLFHPTRRKFSGKWRKRLLAKERRLLNEIQT